MTPQATTTRDTLARLRLAHIERRATERAAAKHALSTLASAAQRGERGALRRLVRALEREAGALGLEVIG